MGVGALLTSNVRIGESSLSKSADRIASISETVSPCAVMTKRTDSPLSECQVISPYCAGDIQTCEYYLYYKNDSFCLLLLLFLNLTGTSSRTVSSVTLDVANWAVWFRVLLTAATANPKTANNKAAVVTSLILPQLL